MLEYDVSSHFCDMIDDCLRAVVPAYMIVLKRNNIKLDYNYVDTLIQEHLKISVKHMKLFYPSVFDVVDVSFDAERITEIERENFMIRELLSVKP